MKKKHVQKRKVAWFYLVLGLSLALSACSSTEGGAEAEARDPEQPLHVVTTIAQIAEPVSIIGGERVQVESLMGPGVDPHLYKPTPGDIQKLDGAEMILYSGLHLEANMVKVFEQLGKNKPAIAIGDTIPQEQLLKDPGGAIDPHIWFDIELWKQALEAAAEELKKASPADAEYFEANKTAYFAELDRLKQEAADKMADIPEEKRVLITAHDAFGYFGRMLDLQVVGLQGLSTEDEVGLSDIEHTVDLLLEHNVPAVFVESSINPASVNAVIEGAQQKGLQVSLGGELFSDAMGAEGTEEGTYIGMYRHNVDTIHTALGGKGE
ncbi:zinc ABC transporter substrate-binding protein [Paenibacillus sp. P96]|uniref:Zinc ABC transporter substrate-binding protein n=1 Tax=Paenibacillus zeirhizosphaerae TaxID=2987519 RepID=A0ABT9FT49_9BACL|nr:zinc ABC transporter substrate-binding protein [Paenibacillus sp. P96]MDP4097911.1 zinc ABC transporter substrate-binding protein [Paenibacillus sp. P96]